MIQDTDKLIIAEYHEGFAAGIAKMWNLSRDSWGGDTSVMTEEQVKTKEANNGNITLYLALDGEEVVGYCGLSEYKEDGGSLYIPLLNVRPDYHGRKIGKMLVLKALQKTIELGWPRLDLYTWPGNVKAVPLYKKCGFFWEDRDDTTHLMNFIPAVHQTPLLKPILEKLDWYSSSLRDIDVKPDGIKENGFTFYEYKWQSGEASARVRFERTGRGISLIETNDYLIELSMDNHEVIENAVQNFKLKLVNKTGNPASFKAEGNNQGRVEAIFEHDLTAESDAVFAGQFIVHEGEEPSVWKTHPSLDVKVWVNGEECELRLGLLPKQPAKITGASKVNLSYLNQESELEMEVENNLEEDAVFHLSLPECDLVELEKQEYRIQLRNKERKLLKVPFIVKKYGFYQPEMSISALTQNGEELSFTCRPVGIPLKSFGQKFGGESKDYWHICNGICQINIRKLDYKITAGRNDSVNQPFSFFVPKLGKPYSTEFSKAKPREAEWFTDDTAITFKLVFKSEAFPGILAALYTSLYGEGLVKIWSELTNEGSKRYENLFLSQPLYHEMQNPYFPLENEVIEFSNVKELGFMEISAESITGNWFFDNHNGEPIGFCWPNSAKSNPDGWQFYYQQETGCLEPGQQVVLAPCYLSIGAFRTWEEMQQFAGVTAEPEKIVKNEKTLVINRGNPVLKDQETAEFTLKTHRSSYLNGTIDVYLNEDKKLSAAFSQEQELKEYRANFPIEGIKPLSLVKAEIKLDSGKTHANDLLLMPRGAIRIVTEKQSGKTVYSMDNGIISLKAAPDFYPGLFSLSYKENEWLDSSFPEPVAKGWWNPWAGGMKTIPSQMSVFSLLKEKSSAEFINVKDSYDNEWSVLAIHTKVAQHSIWRGLEYTQYFALLPGVPILAYWVKVIDAGGKYLFNEKWITDIFISGSSLKDLTLTISDKGAESAYQAGVEEQSFVNIDGSHISSSCSSEKMYVIKSKDAELLGAYMNKEAFEVISERSAAPLAKPGFVVFDERSFEGRTLNNLHYLEFR
ncbi:GNAT family N-acetyltransferase [Cytobacillus firmus]|uniref:GNAT family N-acetyltransferase n=1 Tax=Cytobacillus firmus TaxID=1399 RepID=UPI002042190A|nr:GNAT family N-acetyltransferase [Cytobacillus firmus]MCM3704854.1 GNAT family N-acetyltransferase [Cytobacillus firmus]